MKGSAEHVKEIFVLRSLACLGIVLYNTIATAIAHFSLGENADAAGALRILELLQLLLMFSTPMFVYISEFLLAKAYPQRLPAGFFRKRAKYILIPYATSAVLYAGMQVLRQDSALSVAAYAYEFAKTFFLANFFGYFLLVIFQFYVLHALFIRYVQDKIRMPYVIGAAAAVNVLYLAPFNLVDLSASLHVNFYVVSFLNKVPFPAWLAYFAVAFYCGKHHGRVTAFLHQRRGRILALTAAAAAALLTLQETGVIGHVYSKRFDVLFYTIGMIFCLQGWASRMRAVPDLLMRISQYSFSIFLLSRFVLAALDAALPVYGGGYFALFFALSFVVAVAGSMVISHGLNKLEFGPLLAGKIGIGPPGRRRENAPLPVPSQNR